ncbi:cobalamin-dependent protein [Bdellovibrio sp.]|uniref:MerR family transcriptional regulator n=1 Tax=Bdellovibrio sp. TaxID=28201 RepID=UPI0039E25C89
MSIIDSLLDIDQVNQLTGLPQATLRNWEKRYGFPKPQRSQGGHRLYAIEEVNRIREVANLCKGGMKPREAIHHVSAAEESAKIAVGNIKTPSQTLSEGLSMVLEALYRYDILSAEEQMSRIGMRLSETDLLELIYPKLLMQVGSDWERSAINVAQEHFCWSFLRMRLLNYFRPHRVNPHLPKALLATPPGELHEGGLLLLAAFMMLKGWQVYYLGVNLPLADLQQASSTIKPDVVCISSLEAATVLKNWNDLQKIHRTVVIGGPCLAQLKTQEPHGSSGIYFIEGELAAAVDDIALLVQSNAQS